MSYHLQDSSDYTAHIRRLGSLRTVQQATLQNVNVLPSGTVTKFISGSPEGIGNQRAYDIGLAECQVCVIDPSGANLPTAASADRSFRLGVLYNLLRS